MGTIVVSENITVDGGVGDPTGEEGTPGGGWFAQVGPADRAAFGEAALAEALGAEAFLMGRRTYAFLASRWPARTGALADRLNSIDKYVVSATLGECDWARTTVIGADAVQQIVALKQRTAGEIVVPASFQLVPTLLEHDLVDELRVMVFPVLLGSNVPLLGHVRDRVMLRLLGQRTLGDHLTSTAYAIARTA